MTVEEQRYFEECRKVLDKGQLDVVTMAMDYGLPLAGIRQVVQSNKDAACMKEILVALMENMEQTVIDFLCDNEFNPYQTKEIVEGIRAGLTLDQVKTFATSNMSASRMKKMRSQLLQSQRDKEPEGEDEVRTYMKGLMKIMEDSIRQFRESNERFDALSGLVKEHVVDEKNREIQDLYENLSYKDKKIQELQEKVAERDKQIADLKETVKKPQVQAKESQAEEAPRPQPEITLELMKQGSPEEEAQSMKRRMLGWLFGSKGMKKDMLEKIMAADLSAEQLEEVRQCLEAGLKDDEIARVIENSPTPERMKKMREILLLMRQRRQGKAGE